MQLVTHISNFALARLVLPGPIRRQGSQYIRPCPLSSPVRSTHISKPSHPPLFFHRLVYPSLDCSFLSLSFLLFWGHLSPVFSLHLGQNLSWSHISVISAGLLSPLFPVLHLSTQTIFFHVLQFQSPIFSTRYKLVFFPLFVSQTLKHCRNPVTFSKNLQRLKLLPRFGWWNVLSDIKKGLGLSHLPRDYQKIIFPARCCTAHIEWSWQHAGKMLLNYRHTSVTARMKSHEGEM